MDTPYEASADSKREPLKAAVAAFPHTDPARESAIVAMFDRIEADVADASSGAQVRRIRDIVKAVF